MKIRYNTFRYLPGVFVIVILLTVILFNFVPNEERNSTVSEDLPEIASPVPDMSAERVNSPFSLEELVKPLEGLGPLNSILIS